MSLYAPASVVAQSNSLRIRQQWTCKTNSPVSRAPPERQLSAMLIGVCVAFVCLRLPYTVVYNLFTYHYLVSHNRHSLLALDIARQITDVIATSNYVVNFFMYSLCGSYFRHQIVIAFRYSSISNYSLAST